MTELVFPEDGYVFDTNTPIQKKFINKIHTDGTENALEWLATVKKGECSYPQALELVWRGTKAPYRVELSKEAHFACPLSYMTEKSSILIDNLETDTVYYWRVNGSSARFFRTTGDCPRFIRIDGALNVRDLGGNKIKQGILYRGSAIDGPFVLTENGKNVFRNELKIKTEIELRKESDPEKTEAIVDGVKRLYMPYRPYMEAFQEEHKLGICNIMEIFSDKTRYPIYFNCMGGADRTGMIALFLRSIAGECDDMIHTDYELTALSTYAAGAAEGADGFRSRNKPYYREFLDELQKYAPGKNISICAKSFLRSCGVTQKQIDQIRAIITKQ